MKFYRNETLKSHYLLFQISEDVDSQSIADGSYHRKDRQHGDDDDSLGVRKSVRVALLTPSLTGAGGGRGGCCCDD